MRQKLVKVETQEQVDIFCKMEKEINLLFLSYAKQIEIDDNDLKQRCTADYGMVYINDSNCHNYLVYDNNNIIGFIVYKIDRSAYTQKTTLMLEELYIKQEYRGNGVGRNIIHYLQNKFKLPIELNCYYQAPAYKFYEKLGGKPIQIRYLLEDNS